MARQDRWVKPRTGLIVRYPANGPNAFGQLPAEGARVHWARFWMRRVACGDCVELTPDEIAALKAPPEPVKKRRSKAAEAVEV